MSKCTLARSLHILGPVLGRKRGVEVRVGGAKACTDGNTIWLPALPVDDAEAAALGFGLLFHETNHIRYTDFEVKKGDGLVGALTNALEDIRIDALGHREYPGGRREEELLVGALVKRGEAKACSKGDHPARILESYLMWRLEHDLLGIEAAENLSQESEALFRETFNVGVQTKLDALMFAVRECRSTAAVKALADQIACMLEDEAKEEEAKSQEARADPTSGPGQPTGREQSALRQALNARAGDHVNGLGEMAQSAVNDRAKEGAASNLPMLAGVALASNGSRTDGASFSTAVKRASNALRQRAAGLLQAQTLARRYPATSGRRIDMRRLSRLETGETRAFLRELSGLKTDTAVAILLDRSGSMRAATNERNAEGLPPIQVAREACFAIALALQHVPEVNVAVGAFPGERKGEIAVVTRFGERVGRQAVRFAAIDASGGTPMAEAMLWAASELLAQRNARRILMLLTDGAYEEQRGRAMVAQLARAGIESIGVGIQCQVSHLFALSREIAGIGELPEAMCDLLIEAMRRPATR